MTKPRLHLDADTSNAALADALQKRGHDGRLVPYHDVTRTPNEWMPLDAHDDVQLLGATAQGRCIFTFNARDYVSLAKRYPHHGGIILSSQRTMPELLKALDTLLSETEADDWPGQVRWLCDWMK
ncbi:MAG: DUF5615 family PIN-like protein [Anaerolineales bacterium]|nr:DUF5615 family PIN-like protein [Anaerolineales bacterium]